MVCLSFCQHSDVTFLNEFQQCLNSRYTSHLQSLYTLVLSILAKGRMLDDCV